MGKHEKGNFRGTAPFGWLVRMMFPIAESIGDLIYRHDNPVRNLRSVLDREYEAVRPGYAGKSAALAKLYRHALTHQDELRSLQTGEGNWSGSCATAAARKHCQLQT